MSIRIDEQAGDAPPRFYALASGSRDLTIRSMYRTKLDRVVCAPGMTLVTDGDATTGVVPSYEVSSIIIIKAISIVVNDNHDDNHDGTFCMTVF